MTGEEKQKLDGATSMPEFKSETEPPACVDKIAVKLPPFWFEKPDIWFGQIEAQFRQAGITQELTKFDYLLSQLERNVVENIWDLVTMDEARKYSLAKKRLIAIYKEGEGRQMRRLRELELGEMKPSQLWRKMKSMAEADVADRFMQTLWLDKLPSTMRDMVTIVDDDIDKMCTLADKLWEQKSVELIETNKCFKPKHDSVSAVTSHRAPSTLTLQDLLTRIEEMEQKFSRGRPHDRRDARSKSRDRSKSRPKYNKTGRFCYYHFRFGNKCRPEKCEAPCAWKEYKEENSSGQRR
ncbi:uncharacterized protein [Rhodnius prolixus]|uniref:uncharacterized protein n=1 Tax=Rhodnius prolixus TaxID=13249 RepID=UPI003D18AD71